MYGDVRWRRVWIAASAALCLAGTANAQAQWPAGAFLPNLYSASMNMGWAEGLARFTPADARIPGYLVTGAGHLQTCRRSVAMSVYESDWAAAAVKVQDIANRVNAGRLRGTQLADLLRSYGGEIGRKAAQSYVDGRFATVNNIEHHTARLGHCLGFAQVVTQIWERGRRGEIEVDLMRAQNARADALREALEHARALWPARRDMATAKLIAMLECSLRWSSDALVVTWANTAVAWAQVVFWNDPAPPNVPETPQGRPSPSQTPGLFPNIAGNNASPLPGARPQNPGGGTTGLTGNWQGRYKVWRFVQSGNALTVTADDRGPFRGSVTGPNTISVDFHDDAFARNHPGTVTADGKTIQWQNGTSFQRIAP